VPVFVKAGATAIDAAALGPRPKAMDEKKKSLLYFGCDFSG